MRYIKVKFVELIKFMLTQLLSDKRIARLVNLNIYAHLENIRQKSKNPLHREAAKYFSQCDEDGILLAIINRLQIKSGSFVELGVGDGRENNSLILLMLGWRGVWVGGESLSFSVPKNATNLFFCSDWITKSNCYDLVKDSLSQLGLNAPDVISVDLDGNDLYITRELLNEGLRPSVFVIEYNGKFPPPIKFSINYSGEHKWKGDDYFGASLQSFVDLFEEYKYKLVVCNLTGTNAYFVRSDLGQLFPEVGLTVDELFMPADYIGSIVRGHKTSPATILSFLSVIPPKNRGAGR